MSDAPTVTSQPNTDARVEDRAADRARAQRLVAAWLAGTANPPEDGLRIEPLMSGASDDICFCAGTFCWPTVPTGRQQRHTHLE